MADCQALSAFRAGGNLSLVTSIYGLTVAIKRAEPPRVTKEPGRTRSFPPQEHAALRRPRHSSGVELLGGADVTEAHCSQRVA